MQFQDFDQHLITITDALFIGMANLVGEVLHLLVNTSLALLLVIRRNLSPVGDVAAEVEAAAQHIHHTGQAVLVAQLHNHVVAEDSPTDSRTKGQGLVGILDGADTALDQVDHLTEDSQLQTVADIARAILVQNDGLLAQSLIELLGQLNVGGIR